MPGQSSPPAGDDDDDTGQLFGGGEAYVIYDIYTNGDWDSDGIPYWPETRTYDTYPKDNDSSTFFLPAFTTPLLIIIAVAVAAVGVGEGIVRKRRKKK